MAIAILFAKIINFREKTQLQSCLLLFLFLAYILIGESDVFPRKCQPIQYGFYNTDYCSSLWREKVSRKTQEKTTRNCLEKVSKDTSPSILASFFRRACHLEGVETEGLVGWAYSRCRCVDFQRTTSVTSVLVFWAQQRLKSTIRPRPISQKTVRKKI